MLGAFTSRRLFWLVMPVGVQAKVVKTLGKRCIHTSSLLTATGWITKGVLRKRVLDEARRTVEKSSVTLAHRPFTTHGSQPVQDDMDFLSQIMLPDFDAVLPEVGFPSFFHFSPSSNNVNS